MFDANIDENEIVIQTKSRGSRYVEITLSNGEATVREADLRDSECVLSELTTKGHATPKQALSALCKKLSAYPEFSEHARVLSTSSVICGIRI